jgi:molybdate transport system substrate-binding protein
VPVGAYSVEALDALGLRRALGNVVSREPDVKDVVGKVALGEADAGIVYVTDARAAETRLSTVPIPAAAQPEVRYEIAVVRGGDDVAGARRFVARATGPEGRAALAAAGFLPAPPS